MFTQTLESADALPGRWCCSYRQQLAVRGVATQWLAVLRELGVADDDSRVNPNGGAIALGHPLGMSGARLLMTAAHQLQRTGGRYALCTMCVGAGQGIATLIERV